MKRSLSTGVLSVLGGKVGMFVVTVVTTPILIRLLGSGRYGDYAFVMSVFSVLMILVSSGVGDGVRKFVVEERSIPDWKAHVIGFYFRHATVLALAGSAALALAAASGVVGRFVDDSLEAYFYLLAVLVVVAQFREFVRRALMGFGKEHYAEVLRVLQKVTFAVAGIALVYTGYGVAGVLAGQVLGSLLVVVAGLFLIHRRVSLGCVLESLPDSFPRRELYSFNGYTVVFILLMTSLYHVDLLMLRPIAGSDQTGYYKSALAVAEFLWFAPIALQTVFVHSTSELWSEDRTEAISELASRTTRFTVLLTALLAAGIASLADVFVPLYYGAAFEPAVVPLLLLLPGAVGFAVARPIFAIGQGKGDMRLLVGATGLAAGVNAVLNLLLIPSYGMAGAAVATSVGYGSMLVVHVASAYAIGFSPMDDLRPLRTGTTVLLSTAAIAFLARSIADPVVALAVVPPAGGLLFAGLAVATRAVDRAEIAELTDPLPLPSSPIPMTTKRFDAPSTEQLESVLMVVGVVLFATALTVATPVNSLIGAVDDRNTSDDVGPEGSPTVNETATPTGTPTATGTSTPTASPTATPTPEPTPTESDDDDDGFSIFPSPDTETPTPTPEPTPTPTTSPTPESTPTPTDTETPTPSPTPEPTTTETPTPTATPEPTPTDTPEPTPTDTPEPTPTDTPEPTPTDTPEPTPTGTDGGATTTTTSTVVPTAWLRAQFERSLDLLWP